MNGISLVHRTNMFQDTSLVRSDRNVCGSAMKSCVSISIFMSVSITCCCADIIENKIIMIVNIALLFHM